MSTRNPMNDRYSEVEKTQGKTRKSASSAKPVERAATVVDPPEKTKKQKKEEQRKRAKKIADRRGTYETRTVTTLDSPEYRRLRRIWWGLLILAVVSTLASWFFGTNASLAGYSFYPLIIAYVAVIGAFYIDFAKIRKLRNKYNYEHGSTGKSKAARRAQKQHAAEQRAKRKEYEEAMANGTYVEPEKEPKGLAKLFKGKKKAAEPVVPAPADPLQEDNALGRKIAQHMDEQRDSLIAEIESYEKE